VFSWRIWELHCSHLRFHFRSPCVICRDLAELRSKSDRTWSPAGNTWDPILWRNWCVRRSGRRVRLARRLNSVFDRRAGCQWICSDSGRKVREKPDKTCCPDRPASANSRTSASHSGCTPTRRLLLGSELDLNTNIASLVSKYMRWIKMYRYFSGKLERKSLKLIIQPIYKRKTYLVRFWSCSWVQTPEGPARVKNDVEWGRLETDPCQVEHSRTHSQILFLRETTCLLVARVPNTPLYTILVRFVFL